MFDVNQQLVITVINDPGTAPWQADLFRLQRDGPDWLNPMPLPDAINSSSSEWYASFSNIGNLYFSSERKKGSSALHGDIYRAKINHEGIIHVEAVPGINTDYNDSDPLIAPDESFLVFHSNRPGGVGEHELYIF